MQPVAECWDALAPSILGPLQRVPRHPVLLARFGLNALQPATRLARSIFKTAKARALFMGIAAHANVPLDGIFTAGFGMVLGGAVHPFGWPIARRGSQSITAALASYLRSLGGDIETDRRVTSLDGLSADAILFDLTPRQVLNIAGDRLSSAYHRGLARYRHGAGVFKVDYALDAPVPWTAPECRTAGTVHLGSTMEEIVASEAEIGRGGHPDRPFVLVAQPSLFDETRAPAGKHTLWAYCHVPNGSTVDMTDRIEAQLERFAPGFGKQVLARHISSPADLEAYNENFAGGDISGGSAAGLQLFLRPTARLSPYTTSDRRLFICSSSTPPGAGVHGMCGYNAAQAALSRL
jgi:phytoene dehydrogenase-like protein